MFCIVRRGAVGAHVWQVLVFRRADVCVLCASCGSPQCCVLQFVNDDRGCKRGDHKEEAYS